MLESPLGSSTTPPTTLIGHEPSARCVARAQAHARSTASSRPATRRAIAASTWFQTSVWPPTVHGTAPSGSCTEAIAVPDAATPAHVRSSGPMDDLTRVRGLVQVDHEALAEHRVQRPLRPPGDPRPLDDVPDQEAMVGARQRMIVVADTHGALDPPVRRVERVGMAAPVVHEACALSLGHQLRIGVDADVSARDVVVLPRQLPADH